MLEKLKKTEDGDFMDDNECSWDSEENYLKIEVLGHCGCGDDTDILIYVRDFLKKLDKQEWGDYEDIPYMFLCGWSDKEGYSEHGTTARCSWLTEKGKELLNDLNKVLTK